MSMTRRKMYFIRTPEAPEEPNVDFRKSRGVVPQTTLGK